PLRAPGPPQAAPLEPPEDGRLPAGPVPRRLRVVDPEQHPVADGAVRDGAEGVPDMQRARRAGSESHALHLGRSLDSACGTGPARLVCGPRARPSVAADTRPVRDSRLGGDAPADAGRARDPTLPRLAPALADRRGAGRRVAGRRDPRVAG